MPADAEEAAQNVRTKIVIGLDGISVESPPLFKSDGVYGHDACLPAMRHFR